MPTYTNSTKAFEVREVSGIVQARDLETGALWEFTPEKFGAFAALESLTVYDPTDAYDAMAELFESMGHHDLAAEVDAIAETYVEGLRGAGRKTRKRNERAEEEIVRVREDMEDAPADDVDELVDDLDDAEDDLKDAEPPAVEPVDVVKRETIKRVNEVTK